MSAASDLDLIDAPALGRALLAWFDRHARDLPWRREPDLYRTWISEMMLQQTTVAAVIPFWERFTRRFPDVEALAAADEAEVLALWSGLGYYRRARMLHAAARRIVSAHGGRLPTDRDGWVALPGVGDYAAGAIASIGLGEAVPALDANARRVLVRWAAADARAAAAWTPARLRTLGAALVPAARPGAWNEAVMELGATVCRARDPQCPRCPVGAWCRAGLAGTAAQVPPPAARTAPQPVVLSMAVVRRGDRLLLLPPGSAPVLAPAAWGEPARADLGGLHRGLWGLPTTAWYRPPVEAGAWQRDLLERWAHWAGPTRAAPPVVAGQVRHAITRFRLAVTVVAVSLDPAADPLGPVVRGRSGRPCPHLAPCRNWYAKSLRENRILPVDNRPDSHLFSQKVLKPQLHPHEVNAMLQITRQTEYAIRGLQELARRNDDAPVQLKVIAGSCEVSEAFLAKIFQMLSQEGIVKSHRGVKGGFSLARPAERDHRCAKSWRSARAASC